MGRSALRREPEVVIPKGALQISAELNTDRPEGQLGAEGDRYLDIDGIEIGLTSDSKVMHLETPGVVAVTDATMTGLWHYSVNPINKFDNNKGTGAASKMGPGTYIGYGALGGDRVAQLKKDGAIKHDLVFKGNILLVPYEEQADASYEVAYLAGAEEPANRPMAASKRLSEVLRAYELNDLKLKFDGFMFYAASDDPDGQHAEGVIFNPAETLEVIGE
jgi:hypothetical protein